MSEEPKENTEPENEKKAGFFSWWLILLLFIGLIAAYFFALGPLGNNSESVDAGIEEQADNTQTLGSIDVQKALAPRILGNESAPIVISEHSSLTCSHCGAFHKETFARFKEAYIDTGKAYLIFSDFPLNAPALHASMVARCVPEDRFFEFVQMLFEQQDDWAYDAGYLTFLKEKAGEYGLEGNAFKACVNNEEFRDGLLARLRAAGTQWKIQSTPSFVVNNKEVIPGAYGFEEFSQKIESIVGSSEVELSPSSLDEEPAEEVSRDIQ